MEANTAWTWEEDAVKPKCILQLSNVHNAYTQVVALALQSTMK